MRLWGDGLGTGYTLFWFESVIVNVIDHPDQMNHSFVHLPH